MERIEFEDSYIPISDWLRAAAAELTFFPAYCLSCWSAIALAWF